MIKYIGHLIRVMNLTTCYSEQAKSNICPVLQACLVLGDENWHRNYQNLYWNSKSFDLFVCKHTTFVRTQLGLFLFPSQDRSSVGKNWGKHMTLPFVVHREELDRVGGQHKRPLTMETTASVKHPCRKYHHPHSTRS